MNCAYACVCVFVCVTTVKPWHSLFFYSIFGGHTLAHVKKFTSDSTIFQFDIADHTRTNADFRFLYNHISVKHSIVAEKFQNLPQNHTRALNQCADDLKFHWSIIIGGAPSRMVQQIHYNKYIHAHKSSNVCANSSTGWIRLDRRSQTTVRQHVWNDAAGKHWKGRLGRAYEYIYIRRRVCTCLNACSARMHAAHEHEVAATTKIGCYRCANGITPFQRKWMRCGALLRCLIFPSHY